MGPRCTIDGTHIVLDVFTDENCWERYKEQTLESLIGSTISYHFIKKSYSRNSNYCVSCSEDDTNNYNDDRDNNDKDDVYEMCENIYTTSAKCETKHGFVNGYMKQNGYDN